MNPIGDVRAAATITRQRLASTSATVVVFVVLVGISTFLAMLVPRLYATALDSAARSTVAAAPSVVRDLQFSRTATILPGRDDPLGGVAAAGAELEADLPDAVRSVIGERGYVVDSVEFVVADPPVAVTQVKFRIQDGLEDRIAVVEGRTPAPVRDRAIVEGRVDPAGQPYLADVYEIALSTAALDAVRLEVGDELVMTPDADDLIVQNYGALGGRGFVIARIVGRFDVVDPADRFWFDDPGLREPFREPISIELSIFHVSALVDPGTYPRLIGGEPDVTTTSINFPLRYAWRYFVEPERIQAGGLAAMQVDGTRLQARFPFSGANALDGPPALRWGMLGLLERHARQQRTTEIALSLAALGPLATAIGALALVAMVVVRRRATAISLLRGRGASTGQLLLAQALEGVVIVTPTAIVAIALGLAATRDRPLDATLAGAVGIAVAGVLLPIAATVPFARGRATIGAVAAGRPEVVGRRTRTRRLVLDGTVIVLAAIAVVSLRTRGLGDGLGPVAIDPLLAAVPVLIAVAAGLVLLRLYPVPLHLIAAVAARGRGLIPTFPLWGAARQSRVAALPLLVILVATAMGAFSAVVLETVDRGQVLASWRAIGADWRIDGDAGVAVPAAIDPAAIEGVEAWTGLVELDGTVRSEQVRRQPVLVQGIDPAGFAAVTAGDPAPFVLSAAFDRPPTAGVTGTAQDPLPVILSSELAAQAHVAEGETASVTIAGIAAEVLVVGIRPTLPGRPDEGSFMVAPIAALSAAYAGLHLDPTSLLVRGSPTAGPGLAAAVGPYGDLVHLRSRDAVYRLLHDAPLVTIVQAGVAVSLAIAVVYAVLALLAGLAIAVGMRSRDLQVLRTLGLSRRGLTTTLVIEQVPLVLVALVGGAAVGIGIALLIGPSVRLEVFAGDLPEVTVAIDPVTTLAVGILPMVLGILAALGGAWALRRADLAGAVRFQDG